MKKKYQYFPALNRRNSFLSILKLLLLVVLFIGIIIIIFFIIGYFNAQKLTSILPKHTTPRSFYQTYNKDNTTTIYNSEYKLEVNNYGYARLLTNENEEIISNIQYYTDYEGSKEKWGLDNVIVFPLNDTIVFVYGNLPNGSNVQIIYSLYESPMKLDIQINTKYIKRTIVKRESIIASFIEPVTELYHKNRKMIVDKFEHEYWIDKEGIRFGTGKKSALIYHTPELSSMQFSNDNNEVYFNLDFYCDHPYIKYPYQTKGEGNWIDLSNAEYQIGSERSNHFSIQLGWGSPLPRLMHVPWGFLAGYIFTEHADGGTIESHRAAYFGSEKIINANEAAGGFVRYEIPVTKSVFFTSETTSNSAAIFEQKKLSSLYKFLEQLVKLGYYDICLHTPEDSTSDRTQLEKSIQYMNEKFDSRSWIDHGFYSGKINRECFSADGLDSLTQYYCADLWERYKIRYFWSPAVEVLRDATRTSFKTELSKMRFKTAFTALWQNNLSASELTGYSFFAAFQELHKRITLRFEMNSLLMNKGASYPTPLYWQHKTRTKDFYSWTTDFVKEFDNLSASKVEEEIAQLNKLIANQGIFINHGYFVRQSKSKCLILNQKGELSTNPYFDEILRNMDYLRDNGLLYLTTVRELLDYWTSLEKVEFCYLRNGDIQVYNTGEQNIQGLSLIVKASKVEIDKKPTSVKNHGNEIIFWFDLPSKSSKRITLQ